MLGLALASLLIGIGAALVMTLLSRNNYSDAVERLQRAPVGCETELDFTGTGTFRLYLETKGRIGPLKGNCEGSDASYSRSEGGRPDLSLVLRDEAGDEVTLDRSSDLGYNIGDYRGQVYREITVQDPGTYFLLVSSPDNDFAIAIGRDPRNDTDGLKQAGLIVGLLGLLLAAVLALIGLSMNKRQLLPAASAGFGISVTPTYGPPGYSLTTVMAPPTATTPMPMIPPTPRPQPPTGTSFPPPPPPPPPTVSNTDGDTAWRPPQ